MALAVWLALAILVVALVAGLAYAAVRGLSAFRTLKAAGGELAGRVEQVTLGAEQVVTKLEGLAQGTARLEAALERLRVSRARLNVLLEAIAQVRAGIGRITGVVPRKS